MIPASYQKKKSEYDFFFFLCIFVTFCDKIFLVCHDDIGWMDE